MPSGRVHSLATVTVIGLSLAHDVWVGQWWYGLQLGMAAGLLLSPDLDVDDGNVSYHYLRQIGGRPLAGLWGAVWFPYRRLVPHRNWVSHLPVVGTAIRLGYVYVLIAALELATRLILHTGGVRPPSIWIGDMFGLSHLFELHLFLGLAIVDALHSAMDYISGVL